MELLSFGIRIFLDRTHENRINHFLFAFNVSIALLGIITIRFVDVNDPMDRVSPHLEIERDNDVVIARLTIKSLDALITQDVGNALQRLVDQEGFRKVVINLKQVEYLISETLGRMVTLQTKLKAIRGELRLCHLQPFVAEKFQTTGLTKVIRIWDDEESALSAAWG